VQKEKLIKDVYRELTAARDGGFDWLLPCPSKSVNPNRSCFNESDFFRWVEKCINALKNKHHEEISLFDEQCLRLLYYVSTRVNVLQEE